MRGLFINELGACNIAPFKIKRDPAIIAAGIAAGASLLGSAMSSSAAGNLNQDNRDWQDAARLQSQWYNTREAQKTREHQLAVLKNEQDYEERMYRDYSSPSAMMRQYREAGMNPYLVDAIGATGQSFGSPSAPPAAQASSSIPSAPSTYMGDYSGIGRAAEAMLNGVAVKANVANQSAQTVNQAIQNYIEMSKLNVPKEERDNYLRGQLSLSYGSTFDADRFIKALDLDNLAKDVANQRETLSLQLDKVYSAKERQNKLNETDQLISESVARIGKMASDAKLNEAEIKHLAQDCVESLSRIYRNTAEGSLAEEQGLQVATLLPYIQSSMGFEGERQEFDSETTYGNASIRKFSKSRFGKALNIFLYYLGRGMNAGNIGVNVGAKVGK